MLNSIKSLRESLSKSLGTSKVSVALYDSTSSVHMEVEDFYNQYNPEEFQKGHCNIVAKIETEGDCIAAFNIRDLQGCAGVLVANGLYVMPSFRKRGIGSAVFDFVKEFGKHYGYGIIQASDIVTNDNSRKIFLKKDWKEVTTFINPKSRNNISLWIINL